MSIGRDAEAAKISRFLCELRKGPRVLLIEGEAGIGKTTLLSEGQDAAVQLGITTLTAYPVESEMPLEFAGLADLLETVPASVVGRLPVPQRRAVRQAVLRAEPLQRSTDPRTTATAVLTLLRCLAERHPVAVLIHDLPWLDAPSARVLSFALRRLLHEPVGLLAVARTDWSAGSPPAGYRQYRGRKGGSLAARAPQPWGNARAAGCPDDAVSQPVAAAAPARDIRRESSVRAGTGRQSDSRRPIRTARHIPRA